MSAAELLQRLRLEGFGLTVDGDRLIVTPGSELTDEFREAIRTAKPALLRILVAERLASAINAACLWRGDTEANRTALLAEATDLSLAHQIDLAEHFEDVARIWQAACRGTCA